VRTAALRRTRRPRECQYVYQMLCGNLALNAIDNVVAHNSAAGRSSGSVAVPSVDYGKPGNFGAVSLARSSQGEIVPLVTIDSLALPSCHLIKVDVEGMELDVLEGASSTLRQFRPLLYVENDQPEKSPPLIAHLLALDYRLYWLEPPLYRSDNFFGDAENIFESAVSADMVCVPRTGPLAITVKNCVEITSPDAKRPGGYSRAPTS
jgi:FkbM family methyltransferase